MPFEPFPHQYEGIRWLFSQKHALLADDAAQQGERHRRRARDVEDASQAVVLEGGGDGDRCVLLVHQMEEGIEAEHRRHAWAFEVAGERSTVAGAEGVDEP